MHEMEKSLRFNLSDSICWFKCNNNWKMNGMSSRREICWQVQGKNYEIMLKHGNVKKESKRAREWESSPVWMEKRMDVKIKIFYNCTKLAYMHHQLELHFLHTYMCLLPLSLHSLQNLLLPLQQSSTQRISYQQTNRTEWKIRRRDLFNIETMLSCLRAPEQRRASCSLSSTFWFELFSLFW